MPIQFIQYLRPNGRPVRVFIRRPKPIEEKAQAVINSGLRFECEMLNTGEVSFTVSDSDGEDVLIELCSNGPPVLKAVDKLVNDAYNQLEQLQI